VEGHGKLLSLFCMHPGWLGGVVVRASQGQHFASSTPGHALLAVLG